MIRIFFVLSLFAVSLHGEELIDHTIEISKSIPTDGETVMSLNNLMGAVVIESTDEKDIQYTAKVHGLALTAEKAKAMAEKLQMKTSQDGSTIDLICEYPVHQHALYHYPRKNEEESKRIALAKSKARCIVDEKEIVIFGTYTPAAVTLYVDFVIKIPKNVHLNLNQFYGTVAIQKADSPISVETGAADVVVQKSSGNLTFQSGMGALTVSGYQGYVKARSGMGKISIDALKGSCALKSGSGDIFVKESLCDEMNLETGSGPLTVFTSRGNILATSGSGKIVLDECTGKTSLKAVTGCSNIRIKGDFSQLESLILESGSGSLAFSSTPYPNLSYDVSSGCGKVVVPQLKKRAKEVQPLGSALVRTGSGNIRMTTSKRQKESAPALVQKR